MEEPAEADHRQLSGAAADLSGCGCGGGGSGGQCSDLLWALACLTDELQAAGAPCGDWPQPICPLPLGRTELMCENPSLGTPSIFHLHLRLSLSRHTLPLLLFFFISEPLYLSPLLSAALISVGGGHLHPPPAPSPPLLTSPLVPLLLPGAAVIFPHLRLIPGSGGMYDFICMVPAFYWIPIALEHR